MTTLIKTDTQLGEGAEAKAGQRTLVIPPDATLVFEKELRGIN